MYNMQKSAERLFKNAAPGKTCRGKLLANVKCAGAYFALP